MTLDAGLIEASFAMQYGIRLAREDIGVGEYLRLLAGLMADTPLGRVVTVRAEKNPEKIRGFGEYEHGQRRRWREFIKQEQKIADDGDLVKLQDALDKAFG